jgi:hypothetical protein
MYLGHIGTALQRGMAMMFKRVSDEHHNVVLHNVVLSSYLCPSDVEVVAMIVWTCFHGRYENANNQYMVLLKFDTQEHADEFYLAYNGKPFSSLEVSARTCGGAMSSLWNSL